MSVCVSFRYIMDKHIYSECPDHLLLDQLILFYAEAVQQLLFVVSRRMCYGCQVEHLSQTRHSCTTLTAQQKLHHYFYQCLDDLDEHEVIDRWKATIDETDCPACRAQIKSVDNSLWRESRMKTDQWVKKLFQCVYRMIRLERRFYV